MRTLTERSYGSAQKSSRCYSFSLGSSPEGQIEVGKGRGRLAVDTCAGCLSLIFMLPWCDQGFTACGT